ncbi:MAG: PD40 domain-containing protein [Bacteroidetes bacterium]|nr:PD40 domain-containing protein [Bacteroidota bacterium]
MKPQLLNYKYIFLVCIVLTLSTCKVDEQIFVDCAPFYIPTGHAFDMETTTYPDGEKNFGYIRSNPNNSKELIFYGKMGYPVEGIYKYNIQTFQSELVIATYVGNQMDWSVTDWIVFASYNHIYKCKSNGDSLTRLTFNDRNFWPVWSSDGSQILYQRWSDDGTEWIIMDDDGNYLEKPPLKMGDRVLSWSPDGKKIIFDRTSDACVQGTRGLFYYDFDNNEVVDITEAIAGICYPSGFIDWYNDSNTILLSAGLYGGIYRTNIITMETEVIQEACSTNRYLSFTLMADNSTIIAVKKDVKQNPELWYNTFEDISVIQIYPDGNVISLPY